MFASLNRACPMIFGHFADTIFKARIIGVPMMPRTAWAMALAKTKSAVHMPYWITDLDHPWYSNVNTMAQLVKSSGTPYLDVRLHNGFVPDVITLCATNGMLIFEFKTGTNPNGGMLQMRRYLESVPQAKRGLILNPTLAMIRVVERSRTQTHT